jgi:hypothetical protein
MRRGVALAVLLGSAHVQAAPEVHAIEARSYAGVHTADYSTVGGDTQLFVAERASLGATLAGPLRLRADALLGRFSSNAWLGQGALRAYARSSRYSLGASYGYARLTGDLSSQMLAVHGEVYEADFLTVVGSVGVEDKRFGDDLGFAEILLRIYPSERWVLSPGASYAVSDLKQTRADILLRGEWTFLSSQALSLAVFAQYGGNLYTRAALGLTLYFDGDRPVVRERRDAWCAARFD